MRKRRIDTLESMYGANVPANVSANVAVSGGITYENFIKLNIDSPNTLYTIMGNQAKPFGMIAYQRYGIIKGYHDVLSYR